MANYAFFLKLIIWLLWAVAAYIAVTALCFKLQLWKLPGAYIIGICGRFGTGKTLTMIEQALLLADRRKCKIYSSIPLNLPWLRRAAERLGCHWFAANGIAIYHSIPEKGLQALFEKERAIILLDEAGSELFSRDFSKRNLSTLFARIHRLRHYKLTLLYTCQDYEQIDKELRRMTSHWLHCEGFQRYSLRLDKPILYSKSTWLFPAGVYEKVNDRSHPINSPPRFIRLLWASGGRYSLSILSLNRLLSRLRAFKFFPRLFSEGMSRYGDPARAIAFSFREIRSSVFYLSLEDILFRTYYSLSGEAPRRQRKSNAKAKSIIWGDFTSSSPSPRIRKFPGINSARGKRG